ncbi:hypothetical protein [Actinospongicola halichondriae]|uniref:hypothetical protein n=1 Tax=Actinospongicola halichondriae TaxID=3236844 RepID=UPI003D5A29AC
MAADEPLARLRYVAEDAPTGYGDAADRLVNALRGAGTRVEYRGWSNTRGGAAPALVPFSRDTVPTEVAPVGRPTVVHLVPEYYPLVREVVDGMGPFVAHTVWETDRIPAHWPDLINLADRVVVPTAWNRDVFAEGGVTIPIDVVPHVACDPVPGDGGASLGIDDDEFVVYSIGRWDQRKAMFHTVRAFLEAFDGDDPVVLVVKSGPRIEMPPVDEWGTTNPMAWTTGWQIAHIVSQYVNPAHVRLEVGTWTDAQIAGLHTRGDCYLSLPRGEGWGIGAFDAAAYGNPVVASGWGGLADFLDPEVSSLVRGALVPVEHHAFASYSPDQRWLEPDIHHAAELLRGVYGDHARAVSRAREFSAQVLQKFSPAVVASSFLDVLQRSEADVTP